jgi:sugar phosphate permease
MIKKIFYGWWIVIGCFLIAFYFGGVVAYGFTAFFKPIADEFGWSYTQISLAASIRGLEMAIFAPLFGYLVDRYGPRRLIISGTLTIGFGLFLISRTRSLAMFYGAFIIIALGRSACSGTVLMSAVAYWFRRNLGKALGIMSSGTGTSGLLVLFIVWLIDLYQWRTAFVILGLGTLLLAIPLVLLIRDRPEQYGYAPDGDTPGIAPDVPMKTQNPEVGLKEALKSRAFWHLAIAETIRRMVVISVVTHIMPYLSSIGMSRSRAAFVATSIPLISILGRFGFGWLGDIFDKRYVIACAYLSAGSGLLALSYVEVAWVIFPFLALFPLSWGGLALSGAIVRESFGSSSFGKIVGLMGGIGTIGLVIGPSLAGWTYDTLGSYYFIWLVFAATSIISIALMLTISPRRKHAGQQEEMV